MPVNTMNTNYWRSALTLDDFFAADKAVTAGQFNLLGEYTLNPGQVVILGFGTLDGQQDADGRIYVDIKDNSAAPGVNLDGVLQICYYDANDHLMYTMQEYRTETLRTNNSDRTKQIPFPEADKGISAFKSIKIFFKPDATGKTVSATNSSLIMDITRGKGA